MYCEEFNIESMKNKYSNISKGATFRKSRKIGNFKTPTKMKNRTLIGTRTYDGRKMFLREVA
jgi:hypothetical protein